VKRPKFQITESVVTIMISGFRIGRMMLRSACQGVAPSTVAASSSSLGTWVRPALSVMARNGMPAQTTSVVMTLQPCHGFTNQLWFW
jgi:hypothetical protein